MPYAHTDSLGLASRSKNVEENRSGYLTVALGTPESHGIQECFPDMQAWLAPRKDEEMARGVGH